MASKKKSTPKSRQTTLRHLWLAGLGVVALSRREAAKTADQAAARLTALKQQVGAAQDAVRGRIDSARKQGEAKVGQFSAEVEARLEPVLVKLGLKSKPAKRSRKPAKKAAAKRPAARKPAARRTVRKARA